MKPLGRHLRMSSCSVCTLPFSAPCDDMLAMLVCTTRWLSTHLYMLAYMSMHESCLLGCRLCFNIKKLWTFDPNLHLSLMDTTLVYFLSCFVSFFACILVSMFAMSIMFIYFMPLYNALCIFSLRGLSVGLLSLPLHVRTRSKDAWS